MSATVFPEIGEVVGPDIEALFLERVQDKRPHGHVGVIGQARELLAEALISRLQIRSDERDAHRHGADRSRSG